MIAIRDFKGEIPARDSRLLPPGNAKAAVNCDLSSGAIRAVKAMASGSPTTWAFASGANVDFVPANVSGVNRLLVSGLGGHPEAREGGTTRRWGVVAPDTIPTVSLGGEPEEDASVVETVSYCYTLVTSWGEESKISGASMPIEVYRGQYVILSNFSVPSLAGSGNNIQHIRVYRTAADEAGTAEFQNVMMRPSGPGGTGYFDVPASDVTSTGSQLYDANSNEDSVTPQLGNVQMTEGWDPPPDGAAGGIEYANGAYALFLGKRVYLSVPGYYYAFPSSGMHDQTFELEYDVVGFGVYNQQLVVCTTAFPEIISGMDPAAASRYQFPFQQPCVSKKSIVSTPYGVCYASYDGLFMVNDAGGRLLTTELFTRQQWSALPVSDALCAYHNGGIYVFFSGTDHGFVIDFNAEGLVRFEDIGQTVTGLFVDPESDVLHLNTTNGWYKWDSDSSHLQATFETGIYTVFPTSFSCARVDGAGLSGSPVSFAVYADGDAIHTRSVPDSAAFRLPGGFRAREWFARVVLSGGVQVNAIFVAHSMQELKSNA